MEPPPFAFIDLPAARSQTKPRTTGLTMMADPGLSVAETANLMELTGDWVDFAKVMCGTSRLYPRGYLKDKLALYKNYDVRPFIGGQFAEYVLATQGRQAMSGFFEEAVTLGFETVEISDNCVPLKDATRAALIKEAKAAGLAVLGEVGAKGRKSEPQELIAQAHLCLDAGAEYVLIEADELVEQGVLKDDTIDAVAAGFNMDKAMIELPGTWIAGVSLSQVEDMKKLLIKRFGPDANIANVKPDTVFALESLRNGLWTVGPQLNEAI